jgi:outer membrane protein
VLCTGLPLAAAAQPDAPPRFSAGVAVAVTTQPYEGVEDGAQVFPIPLIAYQGERFQFTGKTGTLTLLERSGGQRTSWTLGAVADWRFQSYDAEDSPVLQGMEDRQGTLEAGARLSVRRGRLGATLTGLADTLGRHGGYEVDARLGWELADGRRRSVTPTVGLRYQSSGLAGYYFGVEPDEGLAIDCVAGPCKEEFLRAPYETGDTLTPSLGITARQALGRKLTLFGIAQYDFLPDAVTDSPIVGEDGQLFAFAGIAYAFER